MEKSADAFRTISEVAQDLDLPQHVLRFWETRFSQIKPLKRGGGRRYYRPEDVELLRAIRHLLYGEGYTIKGVQRILKEHGARAVAQMALTGMAGHDVAPPQPGPEPVGREKTAPQAPPPPSGPLAPDARLLRIDAALGALEDGAPRAAPAPTPPRPLPPETGFAHAGVTPAGPRAAAFSLERAAVAARSAEFNRLRPQEIERLKAALFELAECERLIAQARRG